MPRGRVRRAGRGVCSFGVAGDDVGESVEVLGAGPGCGDPCRGPDFAVDAQHAAHLGDQVGQGMTEVAAQRA